MFEIPDDDDLFSEENLQDILMTAGLEGGVSAGSSHSVHQTQCNTSTMWAGSEGVGDGRTSPQVKKMRVLTDVNCPPSAMVVNLNKAADKATAHQAAENVLNADIHKNDSANQGAGPMETRETDVTAMPRRRSLRKFPGPAGILPPAKASDLSCLMRKSPGMSPEVLPQDDVDKPEVNSSQTGSEVFGGSAWRSLVADLDPGADGVLTRFSVRAMLHKAGRRQLPKGKVPLLLGVVDSMDLQGTDASVVIRDPTGSMQGTLHRDVIKDFSLDLQTGAALVLRQVSVISPSSRTHYLNITAGNIVAIYPANGTSTPSLPLTCPHPTASRESLKECVHAAELEMIHNANALKQSAVNRLRQQGSPDPSSPAVRGGGGGGGNQSNGLFSVTSFPRPSSAVSTPFTPHRPTPGQSGSTSVRFTPNKPGQSVSSSTPQRPGVSRPGPSGFSGHLGSSVSTSFSSTPNRPGPSHPGTSGSSFSSPQGPGPSQSGPSVSTSFSCTPNRPGPSHPGSSVSIPPGSRLSAGRIDMTNPSVALDVHASQRQTGGRINNADLSVDVSNTGLRQPAMLNSNKNISNSLSDTSRLESNQDFRLQPSKSNTVTVSNNATCPSSPHANTDNSGHSSVPKSDLSCGASRTERPSCVRLTNLSTAGSGDGGQSSQQSKWSFKRKALTPSVSVSQQGMTSISQVVFDKKQTECPMDTTKQYERSEGSTVTEGASQTESCFTPSQGAGHVPASVSGPSTSLWDEELDDDLLSQLSDDF